MTWSGVKQLMWIALVQKWRNRLVLATSQRLWFSLWCRRTFGGTWRSVVGQEHCNFSSWTAWPPSLKTSESTRTMTHDSSLYLEVIRFEVHGGIAEDSSILGCATVSMGRLFLMFLRVIMPSSSWSNSLVREVLDADDNVLLLLQKYCVMFWRHCYSSRCCDLPVLTTHRHIPVAVIT